MHQVLEHTNSLAALVTRNWLTSLQPSILKERKRASKHSWILVESDHSMEVSYNEKVGYSDWSYL